MQWSTKLMLLRHKKKNVLNNPLSIKLGISKIILKKQTAAAAARKKNSGEKVQRGRLPEFAGNLRQPRQRQPWLELSAGQG